MHRQCVCSNTSTRMRFKQICAVNETQRAAKLIIITFSNDVREKNACATNQRFSLAWNSWRFYFILQILLTVWLEYCDKANLQTAEMNSTKSHFTILKFHNGSFDLKILHIFIKCGQSSMIFCVVCLFSSDWLHHAIKKFIIKSLSEPSNYLSILFRNRNANYENLTSQLLCFLFFFSLLTVKNVKT